MHVLPSPPLHIDEFADGRTRERFSFRELFAKFAMPHQQIEQNAEREMARAMLMLQVDVLFFNRH